MLDKSKLFGLWARTDPPVFIGYGELVADTVPIETLGQPILELYKRNNESISVWRDNESGVELYFYEICVLDLESTAEIFSDYGEKVIKISAVEFLKIREEVANGRKHEG